MTSGTKLKAILKPAVKQWVRSGHRDQLTRSLGPIISGLHGRVLDIGGGREAFHDAFLDPAARRVRLDIAWERRPDVVGDAARLPIGDAEVDAVVMCEVLEHLPEPGRALSEVHRVLRPGGTLCGSVPFIMPIHGDPGDFFRYTGEGLRHLLSAFGDVTVRGHGNHLGGAWRLVRTRFKILRALDPLGRALSASRNERCPEGYTFRATKPDPSRIPPSSSGAGP